ncbi:MAG: hypothetical protein GXO48_03690 [Chlorobi bacterium]|nr:hypothetical protein [Chlorobiota bacterium]
MRKNKIIVLGLIYAGTISAQNVGIGTTIPTARLHIVAPSGYTSPLLRVEANGASLPYIIIQPDGKVGIGTATPSQTLDVAGNIQFAGALMPNGNPGTPGQVLISQGPGNPPQWQAVGGTGGGAGLCASPSTNFVQKWTGTELCNSVIYDDGTSVGIGTTSPTRKLTVIDVTANYPGAIYGYQGMQNPSSYIAGGYLLGHSVISTNNNYSVYGLLSYGIASPTAGATHQGIVTGVYAWAGNDSTGTVTAAYGVRAYVKAEGSGNIIKGYGLFANCVNADTCFGVVVSGNNTDTTDWGIYVYTNANKNYIGNRLGIGAWPSSDAMLSVTGNLRIDGGDFRPAGNPGTPGQVLVSQGSNTPPQWQNIDNVIRTYIQNCTISLECRINATTPTNIVTVNVNGGWSAWTGDTVGDAWPENDNASCRIKMECP